MKKNIIIVILSFAMCAMLIFMTSCGAESHTSDGSGSDTDNQENISAGDSENKASDVFGGISEIVGNMATVNLAVMPDTGMPVPGNTDFSMNGNIPQGLALDKDNLPDGVTINDDGSVSYNGTKVEGVTVGDDGTLTVSDPSALRDIFSGGNGGFQRSVGANGGEGPQFFVDGEGADGNDFVFNGEMPTDSNGNTVMPDMNGDSFSFQDDGSGNTGSGMQMRMGDGTANRISSVLLDYTGAQKEVIIPIGFPIYALTHNDDGNEVETEIQLSDIQAGNVISITYQPDGKSIDKIIVSQITAMTPEEAAAFEDMRNNRMNGGITGTDTTEAEDDATGEENEN